MASKKSKTALRQTDLSNTSIFGYVRVSSAEQVDNTSLEEQKRRIEAIAMLLGKPVEHIYCDAGVSGGIAIDERPEGKKLIKGLKPGDTVIASKLDRLFRDAADALATAKAWKQMGVKLILVDMGNEPVTENGTAKFLFTILAAVAEMERERIAERVAEGRAAKKARGGHIGGSTPFGYRKIGEGREATLEPVPEQQAAISTIHEAHEAGMSLRDIAKLIEVKHTFRVSPPTVGRVIRDRGVA